MRATCMRPRHGARQGVDVRPQTMGHRTAWPTNHGRSQSAYQLCVSALRTSAKGQWQVTVHVCGSGILSGQPSGSAGLDRLAPGLGLAGCRLTEAASAVWLHCARLPALQPGHVLTAMAER